MRYALLLSLAAHTTGLFSVFEIPRLMLSEARPEPWRVHEQSIALYASHETPRPPPKFVPPPLRTFQPPQQPVIAKRAAAIVAPPIPIRTVAQPPAAVLLTSIPRLAPPPKPDLKLDGFQSAVAETAVARGSTAGTPPTATTIEQFAKAATASRTVHGRHPLQLGSFERTDHSGVSSATASDVLKVGVAGFGDVAPGGPASGPRTTSIDLTGEEFGAAANVRLARTAGHVRNGGFGDTRVDTSPKPRSPSGREAATSAVEILYKPRPSYTPQARSGHIEGEILVEVCFRASGEIQVLRVIRGLGYGLDANALEAAKAVRFRPARKDGIPVDSVAVVHIVFQLAY